MSAETARLASQHNQIGKPGGPGLFHDKTMQLPAYIQNVAKALERNGKTTSQAIQIAIGTVKNWASGNGDVTPAVRAASVKAVAEWEALKARARATPNKGGASLSNPVELATTEVTPTTGMVALEVPAGTLEALPGGTPPDDMHVTLCFLGKDTTDAQLAQAIMRTYEMSHRPPLTGTIGGLGVFPPDETGKTPVYAPVDASGLSRMADNLSDLSTSQHGFTAHITRVWLPQGAKLPAPVPLTPVTFTQLIVKRGDQVFRFPLGSSDTDRERAYSTARAAAIELATPAKKIPPKPAKGDTASAKFGEPSLPPGATHWRHGWVPVNDQGKAMGPAVKPKWLQADEAKHLAAGGKTAGQVRADEGKRALKAQADRAAAPAKKAAAARKAAKSKADTEAKAEVRAEQSKSKKATAAKKRAAAEATRRKNAADRKVTSAAKAKAALDKKSAADRAKLMKAAYTQALADRKAGRALTPAQSRVVAFYEKQQAQTAARLRSVTLSHPFDRARVNGAGLVLDFANLPKGQLAFRYKHGWILINPAIPSRGSLGGGLAKTHGHISGTVTHGHFEPHPSGKGKIFVADRTGGINSPSKLKAAHTKSVSAAKPDKNKYTLAAAKDPGKGGALHPSTPSPAEAETKSKAAHAASAHAQKTNTPYDAQVAAKKHADAFVAHKKTGNTTKADMHKNVAQGWQKKAVQLQKAEKASAGLKAKHDAEQKAEADAATAEKAKTDAAKAKADARKAKDTAAIHAAYKEAFGAPSGTAEQKLAKSEKFKAVGDLGDALNPADTLAQAKVSQAKTLAEKYKTDAAEHYAKTNELMETSDAADEMSAGLSGVDGTPDLHLKTAAKHAQAAHLAGDLGKPMLAKYHTGKAVEHTEAAKAQNATKKAAAPKAPSAPSAAPSAPGPSSGTKSVSEAISGAMDELEGDGLPGALHEWDDYLHAAAVYKAKPTPANLKKMAAAKKALDESGVSPAQLKHANTVVAKHLKGAPAAKKTVAQKKKAAAPAPAPTPTHTADDFKVALPGPGMMKDGANIKALLAKASAEPEGPKRDAMLKAYDNAQEAFKTKYGVPYKPEKVGAISDKPAYTSPSADDDWGESEVAADAIKAGFQPVGYKVSANGDWKPSDVPGLASADGARAYTGAAYFAINSHLRKHKSPVGSSQAEVIKQMDREFAAVPPLDHSIVVYRSIEGKGPFPSFPPPMTAGAEFIDHGYSSTSKISGMWPGETTLEVRVPKGQKALDLNHTTGSQHASENEVLLNRGTKYRIVSDSKSGYQRKIVVEAFSE